MVSDGSYSMTIDGEEGTVIGRKRMNRRDDEVYVKDFIDMVSPSIIQFEIDHYVCGNTYRCVWALREYPTSTEEQAILRNLGEKDGVTLRIYTRQVPRQKNGKSSAMLPIRTGCGRGVRRTFRIPSQQAITCRMWLTLFHRCTGIKSRFCIQLYILN